MKLQAKDYVFVSVQGILFLMYIIDVEFIAINFIPDYIRFASLVLVILGCLCILMAFLQLNTRISPFPTPKSNAVLVQNGIFKLLRHPIYAGILYATFGYGVYQAAVYKIIIATLILVLFYEKSRYEEHKLTEKFPEYLMYKKKTGRFFPKF